MSGASEEGIRAIAAEFDLDPLAVEDALSPRQRPKIEPYPAHLFVVVYQLDEEADQLEPRQVAEFVGKGFAEVLCHGAGRLVGEARKRLQGNADESIPASDLLLHALMDTAVDDDEAIATGIGDEIEELEAQALAVARADESQLPGKRRRRGRVLEPPSQYRLLGLMVVVSGILFAFFKRRRWI